MKNIKLWFLVAVLLGTPLQANAAKYSGDAVARPTEVKLESAASKDKVSKSDDGAEVGESNYKILTYDTIEEIPEKLPDFDILEFSFPGTWERGTVIKSLVSIKHRYTITVSVPDLHGITASNLEQKAHPGEPGHDQYIMVTLEPFEVGVPGVVATSEIFVYNTKNDGNPYIAVSFTSDGEGYAFMREENQVTNLTLSSHEIMDTLVKTYGKENENKLLVNIYSCADTEIVDYAGSIAKNTGISDYGVAFSYTEVFFTYVLRKHLLSDISRYHNEYIPEHATWIKWRETFSKYESKDGDETTFDLDGFVIDKGGKVSIERATDSLLLEMGITNIKTYQFPDHTYTVTVSNDKEAPALADIDYGRTDICIDGEKIYFGPNYQIYTNDEDSRTFEHLFRLKKSDRKPVSTGDGYFIKNLDLDTLLEIISSY